MSFTSELTRQQVFFEVLRSEAVRRFPAGVFTRADGYFLDATQEMIAELSAHICAEKLVEETQTVVLFYRRPYGPWQAFKEKYLGIKPPMYRKERKVTFKRYKTAPHSTQPWPKQFGDGVRVELVEGLDA